MNTYVYEGPVMKFDTCVANNWKAKTVALSKRKAMSNLKYCYKVENGMIPTVKISLPGKMTMLREERGHGQRVPV